MTGEEGSLADRVGASWPPDDVPGGDYRPDSLRATRPLAVTSLGPDTAVALAAAQAGTLWAAPLVATAPRGTAAWRVAVAGDGAATALVAALATGATLDHGFAARPVAGAEPTVDLPDPRPDEQSIDADQTNLSVIVDERYVVKWYRRPDPDGERAPRLLRHLAARAFSATPPLVGTLEWAPPAGPTVTVATVNRFLPDVRDGWSWTVEAVLAHAAADHRCDGACPASFAPALGRIVARLHLALATPSPEIRAPLQTADPATVGEWVVAADRAIDLAIELTLADDPAAGSRLAAWAPILRERVACLAAIDRAMVQPVHGDLHVGQLPAWRDGIAVIDFDGNPSLPPAQRHALQPAARDVAQLLCSLDHVGRVAIRRAGEAGRDATASIEAWIAGARDACLDAYRAVLAETGRDVLLDMRLLPPFIVEQECRELIYAARFLPRWRYAPMAALHAMVAG